MGIFSIFGKSQKAEDGGKAELLTELELLREALVPVIDLLSRRHDEHKDEEDNAYAAPMAAATEADGTLTRLIKGVGFMLPPRDARRAAHLREAIHKDLRHAQEAVGSCGSMFSPLTEELLPLMRRIATQIDELLSV